MMVLFAVVRRSTIELLDGPIALPLLLHDLK